MHCRLAAILLALIFTSAASAQIEKPANPTKLKLELMVVTVAVDARHGHMEDDLLRDIGSTVKSHESKPWSSLHQAIDRLLPDKRETLAAAVDAFSLHTYPDLGQRAVFTTALAGGHDHHRHDAKAQLAHTKVTATPWILDEERFGLGVTLLTEMPLLVTGTPASSVREPLEMTTNTLVNTNEASMILSRSHRDTHAHTLVLVIARVSR
ncbi:hypothetical protein AB1K70_02360 [Bremerella sp. JC770]|uniref:hypothetical protein n=1 Tax=Bremerella sp. JC770 TaxID=3232137 RepID=UPI00345A739A